MMKVSAQEWFDTGMMMVSQNRLPDAAAAFQNAVMIKPEYHEAWVNRGNAIHTLGNHFDAILNYNQAIALDAGKAEYWNNRGATWMDLGCYEKALDDYRHAIALQPKMAQTHTNMGNVLKMQGHIEEARRAYANAIEANPDHVDALLNKSIMDLECGDLVEGFKGFECRWRSGQITPRGLPCPDWNGEDLNGKRLILYAEQGFGDTLHFVRYATVIKEKWPYARITVECRLTLVRLIKTVPGVDDVVAYGEPIPEQDYCCAMMSAPRVLGTTMETIPAPMRYISADPHRIEMWRKDIENDCAPFKDRLKVGICWSGQSRPLQPMADSIDKRRSTALSQWGPVANENVLFFSLQTGLPADQARNPPAGMTLAAFTDRLDDFADTAALIECMDLVISVDTAVVHCAAALGKPTWMLSRFDGCWRWHGDRKDSPWYPTLTQFRQPKSGDWGSVFKEVGEALRNSMSRPMIAASLQTHALLQAAE